MSVAETLTKKLGGHMAESLGARSHGQNAPAVPAATSSKMLSCIVRQLDRVVEITVKDIMGDPDQPRKEFDQEALERLGRSMTRRQLQPIIVRWSDTDSKFVVVAGERRFRAAVLAGLPTIECKMEDGERTRDDILLDQLTENSLREDLKPSEKLAAYRRIIETKGFNGKDLAEYLGVSRATVSQVLALEDLAGDLMEKVDAGTLPSSLAYEVSRIEDEDARREIVDRYITEGLSRDEARETVKEKLGKPAGKSKLPVKAVTLTFKSAKKWLVTVTVHKKKVTDQEVLAELESVVAQLRAKLEPAEEAA
jgi:ParB family transcriptional regulator, chromosome partitioning protein